MAKLLQISNFFGIRQIYSIVKIIKDLAVVAEQKSPLFFGMAPKDPRLAGRYEATLRVVTPSSEGLIYRAEVGLEDIDPDVQACDRKEYQRAVSPVISGMATYPTYRKFGLPSIRASSCLSASLVNLSKWPRIRLALREKEVAR